MTTLVSAVRTLRPADVPACTRILAGLGDWFGLEAANAAYLRGLTELPSFVAVCDGEVVGFASLRFHGEASAELEVLAVARDLHRQGVGNALLAHLDAWLHSRGGVEWFHVKTRGPSAPDAGYERTRRFYLAQGFSPLFETDALWGPEDPALVMVRRL